MTTASRRAVLAGPAVALVTLVIALIVGHHAGLAVRDPDHDALGYVAMVGAAVFALIGVDIYVRAARRAGTRRPGREALRAMRGERWTRHRTVAAFAALLSFYLAYMAYRNLKAVVPLLRPRLFDGSLARADHAILGGHDAAGLLHGLLGTGFQTQIISSIYVIFIVFLPLSLALALVFARDLGETLFVATALTTNWLIGAGTYFLFPSLGPVYANPHRFASLPHSEATHLQQVLMDQRVAFLAHPHSSTPQAIAAFASLHISMSFTTLLAAQLLRLPRRLRVGLSAWLILTFTSTLYLGWHYLVDDLAGLVVAALAVACARLLTGFDLAAAREHRAASRPDGAVAVPELARR